MKNRKVAVVVMNLGGPDSLDAVQPFLFNLFYDRNIINLPNPFRWLLAKFISNKRKNTAKLIYQQIGGKSPIVEETLLQAKALEKALNENSQETGNVYKVFIAMRYWHPMTKEVVDEVKLYSPDHVVLLPLYPQFSTTTSKSSINEWFKYSENISTSSICCYMDDELFIEAQSNLIKEYYHKAKGFGDTIMLFSAHGLPKNIVDAGDPYQWQIEHSCSKIVKKMDIQNLNWKVCYQSKVGSLEWLSPSTEHEIIQAGKLNKNVIIVPISFVSEHSETLVELDIEYKELAYKNGVKEYFRVPTLGNNSKFIELLKKLCQENSNKSSITSNSKSRICPIEFGKCPCEVKNG